MCPESKNFQFVLSAVAENVDHLISSGSFIVKKNDLSTTVGILKGAAVGLSYDVWLKRFNSKSFLDFLVKRIFGSRAKRLYSVSRKLHEQGLPVPKPIAHREASFTAKDTFFISEIIENARSVADIFIKDGFTEPRKIARQLAETIAKWHAAGAVHGDLKWSNIMLQEDTAGSRFFLVDLDQTKLYSTPNMKGVMKDLARFYRYSLELDAEEWVRTEFIPAYIINIPDHMKHKIDLLYVRNKAKSDWERKGRRSLLHVSR